MAWNKKAGEKISKAKAMEMIDKFQNDHKDHVRYIYYDKENIQSLLDTSGCVGVRIYFGKNENDTKLVLVPVNEDNQTIWEDDAAKGGNTALDVGSACPPYC